MSSAALSMPVIAAGIVHRAAKGTVLAYDAASMAP